MNHLESIPIKHLVTEHLDYAAVLHRLGIPFYHYEEYTLGEVCKEQGLNVGYIVRSLQQTEKMVSIQDKKLLKECPVDMIIAYLKYAHQRYIKQQLPYFAALIKNLSPKKIRRKNLIEDLQWVFPLFVEDFIHHIHEEEDTFFHYTLLLQHTLHKAIPNTEIYRHMERFSIQAFALDHDTHDDEMEGIRQITNNYDLGDNPSLHLQVLFTELKTFEKDLSLHAQIENEVLFPKALAIEEKVKVKLKGLARWN
ncbi:MAG: iron-sulfur cluster repair di-iron protein [Thermonemataceae bacterium]